MMRYAIGPALAMLLYACDGERCTQAPPADDLPAVAVAELRGNVGESVMRPDMLAETTMR